MVDSEKGAILKRLRIIRGHISGIEKLIEEDKDCTEILIQMTAVTGSLSKVKSLVNKHLAEQCIEKALAEKKEISKEEIAKILDNILKFNK